MKTELKTVLLQNVYAAYDKFAKGVENVCGIGCASCCTQNVSVTAIEAHCILDWLNKEDSVDLMKPLRSIPVKTICRPAITTNGLADKCLNQIEPPEEEVPSVTGVCPFLNKADRTCFIYEVRPFSCRSFFSKKKCEDHGHADIEPVLLTVNSVFLQVIEHIDSESLFGNIIEMLLFLGDKMNHDRYVKRGTLPSSNGFLQTRPIPGFIIPPEDEYKTLYALNTLYNTEVNNTTFRNIIMGTAS